MSRPAAGTRALVTHIDKAGRTKPLANQVLIGTRNLITQRYSNKQERTRSRGSDLTKNRIVTLAIGLMLFPAVVQAAQKAIIFPFDLIDITQQFELGIMPKGIAPEDKKRLALITDELTKLIKETGRYDVLDTEPIAGDLEKAAPVFECNGCEDDIAKKVEADVAFISTVRKASDVLFTVSVYIRDVNKGQVTRQASSEIFGNTDAMWLRSVRYLVNRRLFPKGATQ